MYRLFAFLLFLSTVALGQTYVFTDVSVIPMDRNIVLRGQNVVVEDGKITAVVHARKTKPLKNATVINGKGKYLIPGLTDAHVHLLNADEFPLYLANGVTTVFNLDGRPAHLAWRKQIEAGKLLGPTIFTSGPIF